MKAGVEPARRARPERAAQRRLDRLAAVARGLPLGLRPARRGHVAVLDQRRHRRVHRVRRRRARRCRSTAASCRAARSARRSRPGTRTASRSIGEVGELVITEPMPSMPVFFWGDADGERYRESYFDDVPRRLAPRRLDRDHRARHRDHLRPLATRRSTAAAIRMGTSEIYRAVLALDEVVDALVVDVPREGDGRLDAAVRRAARGRASSTTTWSSAIASADPRGLLAAPRAQRGPRDRRGAAHAVGQGARGAGQADPHGQPTPTRRRAATRSPTRRRSTGSSTSRSAPTRRADAAAAASARPGARERDEERAAPRRAARDSDRGPPAGARGAARRRSAGRMPRRPRPERRVRGARSGRARRPSRRARARPPAARRRSRAAGHAPAERPGAGEHDLEPDAAQRDGGEHPRRGDGDLGGRVAAGRGRGGGDGRVGERPDGEHEHGGGDELRARRAACPQASSATRAAGGERDEPERGRGDRAAPAARPLRDPAARAVDAARRARASRAAVARPRRAGGGSATTFCVARANV